MKSKILDLESSEKRLASALAERDRELEREKTMSKTRGQKLEGKLQKKKEKIRQLISEYQDKDAEIDRMKSELHGMRDKLKALGLRVSQTSQFDGTQGYIAGNHS